MRGGFGEGRVVMAQEAVALGMADRVATLEDVINGLRSDAQKQATHAWADTEFRARRHRAAIRK